MIRKPFLALAIGLALAAPNVPHAEDIDLFVSGAPPDPSNPNNPNVLIIIDNSANWSTNKQGWTSPNPAETPFKQGQSELRALRTLVQESTESVNIGLAMFRAGDQPDGIYIRSAVRTMNLTNRTNLANLIGDASCTDGDGANGTPRCIFKNFDNNNPEKVNTANIDYGAALFDAFKYFGGCTSPSGVASGLCKTSPLGPNHFGKRRHSANTETLTATTRKIFDQAAYTDASMSTYVPPAGTANSCAKNYVILIGNGFPKDDIAGSPLANVEGQTNQLAMPQFTSTSNTTNFTNIASYCGTGKTTTAQRDDCTAKVNADPAILNAHPDKDTFFCVGNPLSPRSPCSGGTTERFQVNASRTVLTVQATGTSAVPASNKARMADEWARFLFTTDVGEAAGFQNVQVYTIDVFKNQQDQDQTALLFSMAKYGGGRYFQATSEEAILKALRDIMIEIQSVNSVFASASLPINATNRSQNENQVFIGMFRPDNGARPRWYGNLKRYQIAQFGQEFKLADASSPPQEAVSSATGFIQPCAKSFWTTDTTSFDSSTAPPTDTSYWNFSDATGSHIGSCTTSTTSLFSDSPDGPQVEKGAAAQVLRLGNLDTPSPDFREHRFIYTCANTGLATSCNLAPATMHAFDNINVSQLALGALSTPERDRVINFTRGLDVWDENSRLTNTDVRPTVHGDVAHSRPLPVNYGNISGDARLGCTASGDPAKPNGCVVLFYGANDGAFRAVSGSTGAELWSFIAPEHHGKLKRLYENGDFGTGLISYPPTPAAGSSPKDYFFDGSAGLFQNLTTTAPFYNKVWVFPSMRRGGRMLYAFNVTVPTAPTLLWRVGCTNPSLLDTASCIDRAGNPSADFAQMGQTWSTPAVARVKGFSADPDRPVIIVGGGYDTCEDQDAAPNTACAGPYVRRGNRVYVINAETGDLIPGAPVLATDGSVAADVTLVDRDLDGMVDHAYAADTKGGLYRIDFVDPANPATVRAPAAWTITKIAQTASSANRKFLFAPAALSAGDRIYLSIASGDRERPLMNNYPFPGALRTPPDLLPGVLNRGYMLIDSFATTGLPVNLDDTSVMEDYSAGSSCNTDPAEKLGKKGWFINLNAASTTGPNTNMGEQAVTSSTIFGGLVFFSTNRPIPTPPGACAQSLGEARGYALNLLNASGAADTLNICGGARSQIFVGGGLPPSPVTGTVPVGGRPVTVMIGGVQRSGGVSSPIGAQRVQPTIKQTRERVYWYNDTDK